ncbi:MAG TPA: hypothetical protein VFM77_14720 [Terriglobales bacterium]|nr:hypothetical protein [Terriglobales bacterium]
MKTQPYVQPRGWAYAAVAVCCVVLIALTGLVAAVHVHPASSGAANHSCSVCALAHAGVSPAISASVLPALVGSILALTISRTPRSRILVSSQFIRPPPLG